ncbi:MAG: hypothetical protein RLZZ24_215, partial [Pseudomonadota bacterium]
MTMVERAVTMTRDHMRALGNRLQDESACLTHRFVQTQAQAQMRGNRRRQSATRAMDIATDDARRGQTLGRFATTQQHIGHCVAREVTAFEQHRLCAHVDEPLGFGVQCTRMFNRMAHQQSRLVQIGCDQRGA